MKFTVKRELMVKELSLLQGIVEKRNTMPILSAILFDCQKESLSMYATDLEVSVRTKIPVNVISAGKVALPGKRIFDIVKSFNEGLEIEIFEEEANKTVIRGNSTYFNIFGYSPEDFPEIPKPEREDFIPLSYSSLLNLIEKVDYILTHDLRYSFGGALLKISPTSVEIVATDGNRLSYSKENVNIDTKEEVEVILPKKLLSELRKIEGEGVKFTQDVNNLYFEIEDTLLLSRKLDVQFPNWKRAIPTGNKNIAILNREKLKNSIKRVSLFASEKGRAIKFIFNENSLQMKAFNPEIGEAFDKISIEYYGEPLEIIFNSSYILDFLDSVDCEKVRFEMMDFEKATLIKPESAEIEYVYVVMPIKI